MKPRGYPSGALSGTRANPAEGVIVRAFEPRGQQVDTELRFFRRVVRAYRTNLLEEREGTCETRGPSLLLSFPPCSIESVELVPDDRGGFLPPAALAREREPIQPLHVRHWQHNLGEAPIGNAPVSVLLSGETKTSLHIRQGGFSVNCLQVAVCNNYTDRALHGTLELIVPEGWRALPDRLPVVLEPRQHRCWEVAVGVLAGGIRPFHADWRGLIKARLEHEGQTYQDVLEVGGPHTIVWKFMRRRNQLIAVLHNTSLDSIEGSLAVIVPLEAWAADEVGGHSLQRVTPRVQAFSLGPGEKNELRFSVEPRTDPPSCWAVARLAYLGRVDYRPLFDRGGGREEHGLCP